MNHPATFELPTTDTLTSLLTPAYFRHLLREEIVPAAERTGDPLTLLLLDVDTFLETNDIHGRDAGDEVLKAVSQVLHDALPEEAQVCRYGGDEFAAALPDTRLDDAFSLAEETRRRIADLRFDRWSGVRLTCSIGLATYPANGRTDVDLMREADGALHTAKMTGRNKVSLPLADSRMITKTSHYTGPQLQKLASLSKMVKRNEASLLREALDDVLKKYDDRLEAAPRQV